MIIYKIENKTNGKVYIGQTIQKLQERIYRHTSTRSKSAISLAIRKYGLDNFEVSTIQTCESQEELNAAEYYWVNHYDCISPKGYNLKEGGGSKGKFSDEVKKKLSESHIGQYISEERRQKVSEQFKGRVFSEEHLAKIAEAKANWSEERRLEVRNRMSLAKLGTIPSEESKKKMSIAKLGTRHNAKLTWDDVKSIRLEPYRHGLYAELANKYGIGLGTISRIYNYETWKVEEKV